MVMKMHISRIIQILLVGIEMIELCWETVWQFIVKLNIKLLYDPAISCQDIYSREIKTDFHVKTCTQIYIAALLIIAKPGNSTCVFNRWMIKQVLIQPHSWILHRINRK